MPFAAFKLHPDLLKGTRELGFTRATPIQEQAIPPALEGRDVLACAMTGSGKTAAFLLPILHRLIGKPRGTTRALVLTPTRELAAQIEEHLRQLAVHTPISGAAVFGGVGMGPQEHAFRSGVDVIIATPGRLLDHFKQPYAKLSGLEVLVLDEADRMLDMGFLPDIKRVLKHLPSKRQTLFFSATMPGPIQALTRELLHNPATINLERKAAPAVGIRQALYPVREELKPALFVELLRRGDIGNVIVFTRTKHRANRLADYLATEGIPNAKIHGNRSQAQRTEALEGFKSGRYRCLVATDIVARGIDVEQLEHVVNFDVPHLPEDYIHRVGRTARADATGDAFTFVSPEEEGDLTQIERAIGKRLPRVVVPGFDYASKPTQRFEVPIAERIAEIRARKAEERKRAKEKAERRAAHAAGGNGSRPGQSAPNRSGGGSGSRPAGAGSSGNAGGGGRSSRRRGGGRGPGGGPSRPSSGPYR
ncbi:MAG: DEAD/DEAH box helicase [Gemmatimonadaceae bacterium]|nr:DEAD/DEAH box helicase [Gemmatimonadaceae bacterium]NUO94539.1 DEAD/DEAH box helicase [Gemmatimonadaceae bacterium]NUP70097.1 DEAD/DEAH box helicase [Gemmatimonadaceae bacterium]NUS31814.1 DEAD/DEAH box helicase [Gemmatimonadaceae bacterium]NUS48178.1 DEAD/DEAH box helicase [Gemmatimonadaceae bacterium]